MLRCDMMVTKRGKGGNGLVKRSKRLWDDDRTELLDQAELWVEKGKGGRNYYIAWLIDSDVDTCPLCGSSVIKVHDLFSKTYIDLIYMDGQKRVISLEYKFYKWRCLNEKCRHVFAHDIQFATKYDNVTHRLENEIARLVIEGLSYSEISDKFDGPITRQAVGQIFNRWVKTRDEQRRLPHPPQHLAVMSGKTDRDRYTVFLNLDNGINISEILYGVDSADIAATLRNLSGEKVQTVLSDCDPIIAAAVKDHCPNAIHIIPVDYWFSMVAADFAAMAHERIKWCSVYNKDELIMMPEAEMGLRSSDLKRLLEMRPSIARAHADFNRLRSIISRRDEFWVYDELVEWIDAVDDDFRQEMSATEYQLQHYRQEFEAHMNHRDAVPDGLYRLTSRLEEILKKKRTFSTEVLKAKVLYSRDTDLQDWQGVPIVDVITALEKIDSEE